ncbi:GntR family transcriptional regulator [Clostridium sp. D2Q-11]|uniref:GntR family transcriptional regulator n=1 Tax=Anaeromonas frigoriresistens TaxID=2683708 RepID=A0A942UW32_9FIRM|nr:GntR family transcriptional regulator [Anaeromonas frigoriresistens]MBS4537481.1 GntR family transcriptional regulator [Anaeromonas frigoriresistens]
MNIIVSNSSHAPIYEQIAKQIKNLIIQGDLEANEMLPSIRNLAKELQISVITTKRAYEELERDGYISTVRGKGSFVAAKSKELLREMRIRIVEEKLSEAVEAAKSIDLREEELYKMIKLFYEEV